MRPQQEKFLLSRGRENFQIEWRPRIGQRFPGDADLAGLLSGGEFRGVAKDDRGGLQADGRAYDAIPRVGGSDDGEAYGFSAALGEGQCLGEKVLFDAAEEL